jgi:hypothetical protein
MPEGREILIPAGGPATCPKAILLIFLEIFSTWKGQWFLPEGDACEISCFHLERPGVPCPKATLESFHLDRPGAPARRRRLKVSTWKGQGFLPEGDA